MQGEAGVSTREQIEAALRATDADLYRQIGARAYVLDGDVILKKSPGEPNRHEEHGRSVFASLRPDIERIVCREWGACEKLARYTDETELAMVIADTFVTFQLIAMPMVTFAVLATRIGIKRICKCA
jgi:hypothetical protein